MTDVAIVPHISVEGILLEPRAGGIRLKVRGAPAVYLPWSTAEALAREIGGLARSASRTRA